MKKLKATILLCLFLCLNTCDSNNETEFKEIYELIQQHNFFKAKERYELCENRLSKSYQKFITAILYNAFNKLEASEEAIDELLKYKKSIPDSLQYKLYKLKHDNASKMYNYNEAKNTVEIILSQYKKHLSNEEVQDYENNLKIWSALQNVPPQKIEIQKESNIKMQKDLAGLNTLKVVVNNASIDFIFDTGANLSTTTHSIAQQLKMEIIPVDIQVGTITGDRVEAQLAICNKLVLGELNLFNVIFLVLPDKALSFPEINYQINGIVGFPIIEALKEIKITQEGNFIVPVKESEYFEDSNLAMNGLTPLIYLDDKHFTFDTGADKTILYNKFYNENQDRINASYQLEKISFGGAGGAKEFEGYNINYTFNLYNQQITLENLSLLKDKIKNNETVYGNIGQDLIQEFDAMIINFNMMFIRFE